MTDKRFIYDGLYIRDLHGKIPPILTDNDNLTDKYLKELNGLHDEVKKLSHKNMQLDILIRDNRLVQHALKTKNEQLQKELDYIQNSITEHIKHQKTELGQKALKEIIADYNEWMLGHKEVDE